MRMLAVALFVGVVTSPTLAADKNEDKAKDAAVAFLKAVKAKDVDAVVKATAVPFAHREGTETKVIKSTDDFKKWIKERLDDIKDADKVPTEINQVLPFSELKDRVGDAELLKTLEEVMGKDGFVAITKTADDKMMPILVKITDGKAVVVGLGR